MHAPRLVIDPCPADRSERLGAALGVRRITADALVRRGLDEPAAARAFLELHGPQHDPFALGDMEAAVERIAAAIAARERIVVHGDYDVDGICATAVACEALAALGARVEPFLPSRFEEGYGLAVETVERLAAEGADLVVTVDCGITAVAAAERAAELGLGLVITDHHRPADALPACPLVAPRRRGAYPFLDLCGSGVAFKLAEALVARLGADEALLEPLLDLVALATVCDVVPLVDENRGLVRAGLDVLREGRRPGLVALARIAGLQLPGADAGDLGFRLGPRINAAGRLEHPGAALELLTTSDAFRAHALAEHLDALNRQRQLVEDRILTEALEQHRTLPDELRDAAALVLAADGWHPGVIGIVASRLVERLGRPVVLVALDAFEGRGSGRSIPAFDLHGALGACAEHLAAWGGHRAAAGLSIEAERVPAFRAALAAHAAAVLDEDDLVPRIRVDAVGSLADVTLELADELALLEPCGLGNPGVQLLLPGVEVTEPTAMGKEGAHLRFTVRTAAGTCRCVQWRAGGDRSRLLGGGRFDAVCKVERNDWNGTSSVQLVARSVAPVPRLPLPAAAPAMDGATPPVATGDGPRVHDARGGGALAELCRLAATGEGLLVVCADAARRAAVLEGPLHPSRYAVDHGAVHAAGLAVPAGAPWLVLVDEHVARADAALVGALAHVAVLDPPLDGDVPALVAALAAARELHLLWGPNEERFAERVRAAAGGVPAVATT